MTMPTRRITWMAGCLLLAASNGMLHAEGTVAVVPGEYELTADTVLPHLEEALRYARTRSRRCLIEPDPGSLFPLLKHEALAGCRLVPDAGAGDARFALRCENPQAASGSAVFDLRDGFVTGVLQLKMGGKNMTLSQTVAGPRLGPCQSGSSSSGTYSRVISWSSGTWPG